MIFALTLQLMYEEVTISAARLFHIDLTILTAIFGSASTYVTILLQFDPSKIEMKTFRAKPSQDVREQLTPIHNHNIRQHRRKKWNTFETPRHQEKSYTYQREDVPQLRKSIRTRRLDK